MSVYAIPVDFPEKATLAEAAGGTNDTNFLTPLGADTLITERLEGYPVDTVAAVTALAAEVDADAATASAAAATATTKAGEALSSANSAAVSESNAAAEAGAAVTSASNAATSSNNAALSATAAGTSATLASEWADKSTAVTTGPDRYSAKYWADVASGAAIPNDSITNTKLANMATQTIKGRTTAGTGDPEDLSPAQVRAMIAEPWTTLLDVVHSGADTNYFDINITGYKALEITFDLLAASACVPAWRISLDNGATYKAGAADYYYEYMTGYGTTVAAAAGALDHGYWGGALPGGGIPAMVRGSFFNGTAGSIAAAQHTNTCYNGVNYQVLTGSSIYQAANGVATHIRIGALLGSAFASVIKAGSILIVKGRA